MRILFCVQGEGRGHLTQAMAAKEIVESAGHEIVGVVVGMGRERKLPDYFASAMPVALTVIPTLEFAFTGNRSVNMPATIARALRRLPEYARSVRALAALVRERKPDVILNFYEVLTGVYALMYRARPPIIALGHQFSAGTSGIPAHARDARAAGGAHVVHSTRGRAVFVAGAFAL